MVLGFFKFTSSNIGDIIVEIKERLALLVLKVRLLQSKIRSINISISYILDFIFAKCDVQILYVLHAHSSESIYKLCLL